MAKVFLDANILIDLVEKRSPVTIKKLDGYNLFISPLSLHILMYIMRQKIPYEKLSNIINHFFLIPFEDDIAYKSLNGPTKDFEDNVQLHSAAQANCDLFLTNDEKLLGLRFFGKVQLSPLPTLPLS